MSRRATRYVARDRAVRRVDALLRDHSEDVKAALDAFLAAPPSLDGLPETLAWIERLAAGGDAEIQALVAANPAVDAKRVRTLARNLRRPETERRSRAALRALLDEAFTTA